MKKKLALTMVALGAIGFAPKAHADFGLGVAVGTLAGIAGYVIVDKLFKGEILRLNKGGGRSRCADEFKSYNPATNTYKNKRGEERLCPY